MEIAYQNATCIKESDAFKRVELAGRLCYNSEDKITEDSAESFVKGLASNRHLTPLEHARVVIPESAFKERSYLLSDLVKSSHYQRNGFYKFNDSYACTLRALVDNGISLDIIKEPGVRLDNAYYTVCFLTDRGIANECVRHRAEAYDDNGYMAGYVSNSVDEQSMTQRSTRYINYSKKDFCVIAPEPYEYAYNHDSEEFRVWYDSCAQSYNAYLKLLETQKPQAARDVLPLSTATTVVMSGSAVDWCTFLNLRLPSTAHPRARLLAAQIWTVLKQAGIDMFLAEAAIAFFDYNAFSLLKPLAENREKLGGDNGKG